MTPCARRGGPAITVDRFEDIGANRTEAALLEREAELEAVAAALEGPRTGDGRLVVLDGPAGSGITALLDEAARLGRERGMLVLRAAGRELEQAYPFGVALALLAPLHQEGAAPAQLLARAAEVGEGDGPFGVISGLHRMTAELAARHPLLLLVDDLHWADEESLRFLLFLAGRLDGSRIALVAAARRRVRDRELLEHLRTQPGGRVLRLEPLSHGAVVELVRRRFSAEPDPRFASAVHEVTSGRPSLVTQLLDGLDLDGIQPTADAVDVITRTAPEPVVASVRARLARQPADAAALVRAAALLGDGAALRLVAVVAELDLDAARAVVERLVAVDVLQPGDAVRFTEPIVATALASSLPADERAAGHARAARALAGEGGDREAIAGHLLETPPGGDPWVVEQLWTATQRALADGAPERAARYLARALAEPPPVDVRGEVLVELGLAEAAIGDGAAVTHLEDALGLLDSRTRKAEVLAHLGWARFASGDVAGAARAFRDGTDLGPVARAGLLELLSVGYAATARWDADLRPDGLRALGELSAPASSTAGQPVVRAQVAAEQLLAGSPQGPVLAAARSAVAGGLAGPPVLDAALALAWADDLTGADALLSTTAERAAERHDGPAAAAALAFRALVRHRAGRLTDAVADASDALTGAAPGSPAAGTARVALVRSLLDTGDVADAGGLTVPVDASHLLVRTWALDAMGSVDLATGRWAAALDRFEEAGALAASLGDDPPVVAWRLGAAAALLRLGRNDDARRMVAVETGAARASRSSGRLGAALVAAAALDPTDTADLLSQALDVLDGSPLRLLRARALVDLGSALRRSGRRTDAAEHLEAAEELAEACGAVPLAERARTELAATGVRRRAERDLEREEVTGLATLTPSERRVVELAAGGATNREIATDLFVSVKAVEFHLRNAYRKLHITSRRELAAVLEDA